MWRLPGTIGTADPPRDMARKSFWEPWSWERTGIGMSRIYHRDVRPSLDVKRIVSASVYGLDGSRTFLPLQVQLRFDSGVLAVDRAVHGAKQTYHDPRTFKRLGSERELFFLGLWFRPGMRAPFAARARCPLSRRWTPSRRSIDDLADRRVEQLVVRGNDTLAVSLLPTQLFVRTDSASLRIGFHVLRRFSGVGRFPVLVVHAGRETPIDGGAQP